MRFYTQQECESWLAAANRHKPDKASGLSSLRIEYPREPHRMFYYARWIAESLTYKRPTLLWITEWGIWGSSENWHLYSKLREVCGDTRLLHESPGHYFLDYEMSELASFLQIAMLNGWGGYVLTEADYVNVFFSHDEYMDFFSNHSANLPNVRDALGVDPTTT
jgi:hypothetical protein